MNQRPSGYEPDELPDCSTPRRLLTLYHAHDQPEGGTVVVVVVAADPVFGTVVVVVPLVVAPRACAWATSCSARPISFW